jgi:nucleotide-binding universal stress UspA family protein
MAIKHLLVHLDSSERTRERLSLAIGMASRHGARLTGLFAESGTLGGSAVGQRSPQNMARALEEARALFQDSAREAGLATDWWQLEQHDYGQLVGWTVVCCRYVDLALFGQHDPEHDAPLPTDMLEQVLVHSGRPMLVVPYVGKYPEVGKRVLVAWTGSRESARALNDAIPLMKSAEQVTVLSLQQPSHDEGKMPVPPVDVIAHLAAHGIAAEYERVIIEDLGAVDNVLNRAAESSADLTVMGGYHHYGFPLLQRSSTTRDILRTMTTPVLLSR